MAAELFTNRSGKQVEIPEVVIPKHVLVGLLRLQEDYQARNEHLSLLGVILDVVDKGTRTVRNQWKNMDTNKNRREFTKAITPLMRDPVKNAAEIQRLAKHFNIIASGGTQVDMSAAGPLRVNEDVESNDAELTDEQLDAATSPSGTN